MKRNIHILILLPVVILLLTVLSTYIAYKYTSKNIVESNSNMSISVVSNNTNPVDSNDEEVTLGDTKDVANCAEYFYYCDRSDLESGYHISGENCVKTWYAPATKKNISEGACISMGGTWKAGNSGTTGDCSYQKPYSASKKAQKYCTKCVSTHYLNNKKQCIACSLTAIKGTRLAVSPGTEFCVEAAYESHTDECTAKFTYNTPNGSNCLTPTSKNSCKNIVITATNGVKSVTFSAYVYGDWEDGKEGVYKDNMVSSKDAADAYYKNKENNTEPKTSYGTCVKNDEKDSNGKTTYKCTGVKKRSACNVTPMTTYDYCCVNNQFVGVSKKVVWAEYKLLNNTKTFNACAHYYGEGYTLAEGISKDNCKVTEDVPDRCNASVQVIGSVNESTKACEEEHTTNVSEGEVCSGTDFKTKGTDINNTFYTITCDKTITTNFDYGDDGIKDTPNELLRGQGFKYGIIVTTKSQCIGEFKGDKWTNTYKKLWTKVELVNKKLVDSCSDFSKTGLDKCDKYIKGMKVNNKNVRNDVYKLLNIIRELVDIVNTYNDYEPTTDTDESANISFTYLANGITKEVNTNFVRETAVNKGNYVSIKETTVKIGPNGTIKGLTNPKNYTRNNYSSPRVTKLIPPKVSINRINGVDVYVEEKEKEKENNNTSNDIQKVDGGNKIYLDYGADIQTISPITIKVSGLGGGKSTVTNNKCKLKIQDTDLLYRPIDVGNPFINNDWKKGQNWVNETYDFTSVIHANTWSEVAYSIIDITAQQIKDIKYSNDHTDSPYLGLCEKDKDSDEITQYLCCCINNKSCKSC